MQFTMPTLFLAVLLVLIFGLFARHAQAALRRTLHARPALVWLVPPLLTGYFAAASAAAGTVNGELAAIVLAYTAAPVLCAWWQGAGTIGRPTALDFGTVLLLWLPLEFPAGAAHLVAKHSQGFLHSVAYGIAILLGLVLFAGFRSFDGMKYNPPERPRDLWLPLAGFALVAPPLIILGTGLGFMAPFHLPTAAGSRMALAAPIIFAATALPEEILFRSIIQNLLMQRFGATTRTLAAASLIFGAAHLDNGPLPLPNWRYFILASIAGFAYGKVFQKSSTVLSSTLFHAMVDWAKHFFF
jgi:membrane protease YdiL (CAAX protease family)